MPFPNAKRLRPACQRLALSGRLKVKGQSNFHFWNLEFGIWKLKSGYSYIEIVLSLFLVMAILTILFASAGTLWISHRSNLQTIATKIASCEIESLRKLAFDSLPDNDDTPTIDPSCDQYASRLPSYNPSRVITDYGSPADPKIKLVTITINYVAKDVAQNITLETLISENGL